jgi:hypothetical protein
MPGKRVTVWVQRFKDREAVALVAVLMLAVLSILYFLRPWDPLESARRRVPIGGSEDDVQAMLGPADGVHWLLDSEWRPIGRMLFWWHGEMGDSLLVEFDLGGRAVKAEAHRRGSVSLWERLRAWWPW